MTVNQQTQIYPEWSATSKAQKTKTSEVYKYPHNWNHQLLAVAESKRHLFILYVYNLRLNKSYSTYLYWTNYLCSEYYVDKEDTLLAITCRQVKKQVST